MKLIYQASNINEANIVSGMLRSNGIDAHVGGYYLQGGVGDLAAFDFANVHVPDDDVSQVRSLIAEYENTTRSSGDIDTEKSRKFVVSIILFVLILIIFFIFCLISSSLIHNKYKRT